MKNLKQHLLYILATCMLATACNKIDRLPETEITDPNFWNTETDLMNAANRLYQQLPGDWIDNRADDAVNTSPNAVSTGNRSVPNTSGDWNDRYSEIFTANNILEKGVRAQVPDAVRNRYFGEARFFRAYSYFKLFNAGVKDLDNENQNLMKVLQNISIITAMCTGTIMSLIRI